MNVGEGRLADDSGLVQWAATMRLGAVEATAEAAMVGALAWLAVDDAGLDRSAMAVSMMSEFMVDWMKDNARWVDALIKVTAAESDANAELISGWYRTWRDRAVEAWAKHRPGTDVFEDRDLEITSYMDIDVERQVHAVTG